MLGEPRPSIVEVCSGCGGGGPLTREFCEECHARIDLRLPTAGMTPGGNPVCPKCGRWYILGEQHECQAIPTDSTGAQ